MDVQVGGDDFLLGAHFYTIARINVVYHNFVDGFTFPALVLVSRWDLVRSI